MNPNDERYLELAEKWLNGTITPQEEEEYAQWYNSFQPDDVVEIPVDRAGNREALREKILQKINQKRKGAVAFRQRKYRAAAAIFALLCGSAYFFWHSSPAPRHSAVNSSVIQQKRPDIVPGTTGAVLTLPDGRVIVLDTAGNGRLAGSGEVNIIKSDGTVAFVSVNKSSDNSVEFNTLATPRGRQQQLVLPDGSKVWLNAESSIRFPNAFNRATREVDIAGEAYFEVAKNSRQPFTVHVNNASIEVLGTHFNVMAYENEPALETTLLEGSIKFRNDDKVLLLKPGQQSRLRLNNELKLINDADVELAVAWKNGVQAFERADLKTIMNQVERWYDVDVEFTGNVPARTFSGEIPRSANLSGLLKLFEATNIHFSIDAEKKKLTVMP
jgi:transmembrane sensor